MSEDLPQPIIQATPVVSYTGTLSNPLSIATYRNAAIINTPGIVYDDPTSIAVIGLDYSDTNPGTLLTIVSNITHIIWGSSVFSDSLTSASFPDMVLGGVTWVTPALAFISMPKLIGTTGGYGIDITSNSLVELDLPNCQFCENLINLICPALRTVTCPKITFANGINITASALVSVSMPMLKQTGEISISGGSNFTNILFGNIKLISGDVTINGALSEHVVDYILVMLANMENQYSNHTVTLRGNNAAPSLIGLAAKQTLVSHNNIVDTN